MPISIIKTDKYETGFVHDRREEFLLDGVGDVASLPTDSAPGSFAYTADMANAWQMNSSMTWVQVKRGSSGGGSSADVTELQTIVTELQTTVETLTAELENKVNAEEGKGLSTNDLTDELLEKINNLTDSDESVINVIKINNMPLEIVDNEVNIPIAAEGTLGVVMSTNADNGVTVHEDGTMEVNALSMDKLIQDEETTLIINGGDSSGY